MIQEFLQDLLAKDQAPSTPNLYMAEIPSEHRRVDNYNMGNHHLGLLFFTEAQRLSPPSTEKSAKVGFQTCAGGLVQGSLWALVKHRTEVAALKDSLS